MRALGAISLILLGLGLATARGDERAALELARWAVGRAPRLAGVLGAARLVERLPVDVRSVRVREGALSIELRGRTGEACDVGFVASGVARVASATLAAGEAGEVTLPWPERARWP